MQMNLREFTDAVDRETKEMSSEELWFLVHGLARKVPENAREEFLDLIGRARKKETGDSENTYDIAAVARETDRKDIDATISRLEDQFHEIEEGTLALRADYEGINVDEFIQNAQTRYDRHFGGKEEYFLPERIEELREIIIYCQEHNITPVLITTPFSKYYSELVSDEFLQEFYDTIHTIADDTQVNYYDYSRDPRFYENLELFSDPDHLTEDGALYFTDLLWDEIEELQRFH